MFMKQLVYLIALIGLKQRPFILTVFGPRAFHGVWRLGEEVEDK